MKVSGSRVSVCMCVEGDCTSPFFICLPFPFCTTMRVCVCMCAPVVLDVVQKPVGPAVIAASAFYPLGPELT